MLRVDTNSNTSDERERMNPGELANLAVASIYDGVNTWNDSSFEERAIGQQLTMFDTPLLVISVLKRRNYKPTLVLTNRGRLCWVLDFRLNPIGEVGW